MMDFGDLVPPARTITVGGRQVQVTTLRMRQLSQFQAAIAPIWASLIVGDYLTAIAQHEANVIEAVRVATDLEAAFLADLRPDEFLLLTEAVIEVNLDFFARAAIPATIRIGEMLRRTLAQLSESPPSLSASDTATPTSSTSRSYN